MSLVPTLEAMTEHHQSVVRAMADAARLAMKDAGWNPLNDDRAALFDEACAKFYIASMGHALRKGAG